LEGMEISMQRLLALIDDVYKYVDDVVVSKMTLPSSICSNLLIV
jgi:translation initiation factor 3 subunit F